MEDIENTAALKEINEVFSEKAKDALAIAMVTRSGEVLYHYAARGEINRNAGDAAYVMRMIEELFQSD